MIDIAGLLQQGAGNIWLFIPSAILLGALHGLEPGHSKTMMAAFRPFAAPSRRRCCWASLPRCRIRPWCGWSP
jgi:hypothetical protein